MPYKSTPGLSPHYFMKVGYNPRRTYQMDQMRYEKAVLQVPTVDTKPYTAFQIEIVYIEIIYILELFDNQ